MAAAAEKRGFKRICTSCGTRFYDLEKRPIVCPNCSTEFTVEAKVKTRRTRAVANDEETVKEVKAVKEPEKAAEEEEVDVTSDVISLDEVEDLEKADDDDDDDDLKIDDDDDIGDLEDLEADADLVIEEDKEEKK